MTSSWTPTTLSRSGASNVLRQENESLSSGMGLTYGLRAKVSTMLSLPTNPSNGTVSATRLRSTAAVMRVRDTRYILCVCRTLSSAGIGLFQDVTMRLIAEQLLDVAPGTTFVDRELVSHKLKALPPPKDGHLYHVCCSELNPGALALMHELAEKHGFELKQSDTEGSPPLAEPSSGSTSSRTFSGEVLLVTTNADHMTECDHLLLHLTSQTWTRGDASTELGNLVQKAMDLGVHVQLTHESEQSRHPQTRSRRRRRKH
jgi:hypothetical protein